MHSQQGQWRNPLGILLYTWIIHSTKHVNLLTCALNMFYQVMVCWKHVYMVIYFHNMRTDAVLWLCSFSLGSCHVCKSFICSFQWLGHQCIGRWELWAKTCSRVMQMLQAHRGKIYEVKPPTKAVYHHIKSFLLGQGLTNCISLISETNTCYNVL